jgi:DNA repair protein RecN (Recombination protein N)
MLVELRISNLAVIKEAALEFGPGLNVLSGETGAGKTIIMSALGLLLGMRGSAEMVRSGAAETVVEGAFELEGDSELRSELAEFADSNGEVDSLVIRRVIAEGGRSRVLINGALGSVQMLSRIGTGLVQIYGQHEQQALLRSESHREILDRHAGLESELRSYRQAYDRLRELQDQFDKLTRAASERATMLDFARFRVEEIERVNPCPNEDEELLHERSVLANASRLAAAADEVTRLLDGPDGGALDMAARAQARLNEALLYDSSLEAIAELISAARANLEEAAHSLVKYSDTIAANPARLEEIEARLQELTRIKRKYGGSLAAVRETLERSRAEIQSLENITESFDRLQRDLESARERLLGAADQLSRRRRDAAIELARLMGGELRTLGMKSALFEARVSPIEPSENRLSVAGRYCGQDGADSVEFFFSPNLGQPPMPLLRIASGGELSRVMLALKRLEADRRGLPTMIFDEVDAGIGGQVAQVVGRKLKQLARFHQVLCVTHLPQIAAFADRHFLVEKRESKGTTVSLVSLLGREEREREIARMLGGASITDRLRQAARELIERAGE